MAGPWRSIALELTGLVLGAALAPISWAADSEPNDVTRRLVQAAFEGHERGLRDFSLNYRVTTGPVDAPEKAEAFSDNTIALTPPAGSIVTWHMPLLPSVSRAIVFDRNSSRSATFVRGRNGWSGREYDGRPLEVHMSALPMLGFPLEVPLSRVVA